MDFSEALQLQETLVKYRRYLHQNPEIGLSLPQTVAYVTDTLKKYGYTPVQCGNGVTATVGKGSTCILLRADMDALPIQEQTNLPFCSKIPNAMHACGHDLHTAMLLGAAKLLKEKEHELNGVVKLMFQPAEEILCGAQNMIDCGILENPTPDAALMVHVGCGIPIKSGTIIVSAPGTVAPSADHFEITVTGKGCHGSTPQKGIDVILTSNHIFSAISTLQIREFADTHITLTFGAFNAGTNANVMPEKAVLKGTLRMFDETVRPKFKDRLVELTQSIAQSFQAKAEVDFFSGCPAFKCDENLSDFALKIFDNAINAADFSEKAGGSEDFAYISQKVPTLLLNITAGDSRNGYTVPLHNPKTNFDESSLSVGCFAYTKFAMNFLKKF